VECDLERKRIIVERNKNETILNPYDVLVGCDGVNSVVRNAIKNYAAPKFVADKQDLPGEFKVARLNMTPPKLDGNAVALIIPKTGSCTAFMEPTVNGSCCILFAGRGGPDNPILSSNYYEGDTDNRTAFLVETLEESFPLLVGADLESVAEQLITQKAGLASSVTCNVYHYESSVAIAGDAAHATGGVSGQGVNSALLDSVALSDCIKEHYDPDDKD
jgi:kynurenine 3-monooxygenase